MNKGKYDAAFGGARREEEKISGEGTYFSFRDRFHQWDPKTNVLSYGVNTTVKSMRGESIRVFPLSNWTELDIWQYIHLEQIEVVPLYFAKPTTGCCTQWHTHYDR